MSRILGVSRQRIYYWRREGVVPPKRQRKQRGYTFNELLAIKVVKSLVDSGVKVRAIKEAVRALKELFPDSDNPLTERGVFASGKEVCIIRNNQALEVRTGQYQLFKVQDYIRELKKDLKPFAPRKARKSA